MNVFQKIKAGIAANRINEEILYEKACMELSNGEARPGLYAKALAKAEGNEKKAKALYLSLRVQSMQDEYVLLECMQDEFEKNIKTEIKNKNSQQSQQSQQSKTNQHNVKSEIINNSIRKFPTPNNINRAINYVAEAWSFVESKGYSVEVLGDSKIRISKGSKVINFDSPAELIDFCNNETS